MAGRDPQPALRLRPLRAELRAAFAAQLLVQQRAGLVPGLRRLGHANRHESRRLAPRSEAHARPRRRGAWPDAGSPLFARDARCVFPRHGHSHRRAVRRTQRPPSPVDLPRHRRAVVRRAGARAAKPQSWHFAVAVRASNTRAFIRRWRRPAAFRPAFRAKLEYLVDEVECSVCGGSRLRDDAAAVQLRDRTIDDLCRMPLGSCWRNSRAGSSPTPSGRSPARWAARFAIGCNSWSMSASNI